MRPEGVKRLVIESATEGDLDRLVDLERASFSAPWTRKLFEVELRENPFGYVWVARTTDERLTATESVVGYLCFWILFEELRLMTLAVEVAKRRQGIATELVRAAVGLGQARGAQRALLEVRRSNVPAHRLYERMGFRAFGSRTGYYTNPIEDALLMELAPLTDTLRSR